MHGNQGERSKLVYFRKHLAFMAHHDFGMNIPKQHRPVESSLEDFMCCGLPAVMPFTDSSMKLPIHFMGLPFHQT